MLTWSSALNVTKCPGLHQPELPTWLLLYYKTQHNPTKNGCLHSVKTGFRSLVKFTSHFNSRCLVYGGFQVICNFFNRKSVASHLLLRTRQLKNLDEDRLSAVFRQWNACPLKLRRRIPARSSVVTCCWKTCFIENSRQSYRL